MLLLAGLLLVTYGTPERDSTAGSSCGTSSTGSSLPWAGTCSSESLEDPVIGTTMGGGWYTLPKG